MLKLAQKIAIKSKSIYIAILVLPLLAGCMVEIPTQGALITEKNAQPHPFTNGVLYGIKEKKDGGFESGKAMTFKILDGSSHDYEMSMLNKDGSIQQRLSPIRFLALPKDFYLMSFPHDNELPDHWVHRIFHYDDGDLGVINANNEELTDFMMQNVKELAKKTEGETDFLIIKNREKVIEQINIFVRANQGPLKYTNKAFDEKGIERFMAKNKP